MRESCSSNVQEKNISSPSSCLVSSCPSGAPCWFSPCIVSSCPTAPRTVCCISCLLRDTSTLNPSLGTQGNIQLQVKLTFSLGTYACSCSSICTTICSSSFSLLSNTCLQWTQLKIPETFNWNWNFLCLYTLLLFSFCSFCWGGAGCFGWPKLLVGAMCSYLCCSRLLLWVKPFPHRSQLNWYCGIFWTTISSSCRCLQIDTELLEGVIRFDLDFPKARTTLSPFGVGFVLILISSSSNTSLTFTFTVISGGVSLFSLLFFSNWSCFCSFSTNSFRSVISLPFWSSIDCDYMSITSIWCSFAFLLLRFFSECTLNASSLEPTYI